MMIASLASIIQLSLISPHGIDEAEMNTDAAFFVKS